VAEPLSPDDRRRLLRRQHREVLEAHVSGAQSREAWRCQSARMLRAELAALDVAIAEAPAPPVPRA
jgi:hypothetical protein